MRRLKELYAAHFYEAASYHAKRVRLLQNPLFSEYDEDDFELCTHAAMCIEMYITGKVLENNPLDILPSQNSKNNTAYIALIALQNNDANAIDINTLASLQTRGAADMLTKYIDIESSRYKNSKESITQSGDFDKTINSVRKYAGILIDCRNDILHRHHMQTLSISPIQSFTYFQQSIDFIYGEDSKEHQYLTGTYSDSISALTQLLQRYLNASSDGFPIASESIYNKQIHKINRTYTTLMQKHQYPHLSITADIVICPKCNHYAFMLHRIEALFTYWQGEPNNSPSVLGFFNPSGEPEEVLQCPSCNLKWEDNVLQLYRDIGKIKHIKNHIRPNELLRKFSHYYNKPISELPK